MNNDKKIVFLTYLNRSGSTYLAKVLNDYEDIAVGLEAKLPDGLEYGKINIQNECDLKEYIEKIYKDVKFNSWKIEKEILFRKLQKLKYPIIFKNILFLVLREYFKIDKAKIFIHKNGHYIKYIEKLRAQFKNAKFIFIDRDPRAIFNSQKNSIDSITRKKMSDNPVHFVFKYKEIQKQLIKYDNDNFVYRIYYEDLIRNQEDEIKKILHYLNASDRKLNTDYYKNIPEEQKHLHNNLNSPAISSRIHGWKKELNSANILFLQMVLKKDLANNGFEKVESRLQNLNEVFKFINYIFNYTFAVFKLRIRSIVKKS